MRLEDVAAEIRPRNPWEAADLGFLMIQAWWRTAYTSFAVIFVIVIVISNLIFGNSSWTIFIVWWLKPLYDRVILFVISRGLFGSLPSVRQALNLRQYFNSSLLLALTLYRFSIARSFNLPIWELEGLSAGHRRKRSAVLRRNAQGTGIGTTWMCLHLEASLMFGFIVMVFAIDPNLIHIISGDELYGYFRAAYVSQGWMFYIVQVTYYAAVFIIEPFFVAAGFAQYINRRTYLEAWDIEISFRQLANRVKNVVGYD